MTTSSPSTQTSVPAEVLGRRIQQSLQVILAGLDEHDALSRADTQALRRELGMLLQLERMQIAAVEIEKAEQVLDYMLRPSMGECLNVWFGKSEQTDQEIWSRFGSDVALASRGISITGPWMSSTHVCWWRW